MLSRELWPAEGPLLLAVSGGADSTTLLLILARLAKLRRIELHVAYFDHGLRASAVTAREAEFVRSLSYSSSIPFSVGHGDVAAQAQLQKISVEDAARRERYEFLARTARVVGSTAIATGHTASDQAETVLHHIIRGSGLDGLQGMAPSSQLPVKGAEGLKLVRPLLRLSRNDTEAYCAALEIAPMQDETNASPDYTRNRIRHEVLPLLRTFNSQVEAALGRLAEAASRDATALVIRGAIINASSHEAEITSNHVEALAQLVTTGRTGDRLDLPEGVTARLTRGNLTIGKPAVQSRLPADVAALTPEDEVAWGPLVLGLHESRPSTGCCAEVDAAALPGLLVRRRRDGDRFQPLGMDGTKKLQDFLVDAHVPREERDRTPIFETERGIIWVGGLRIAEWGRPQPGRPTAWLSFRQAT